MADLELTRTPGDRRVYELTGIGTLRLEGWSSRSASAQAGELAWRFARRGVWRPVVEATDATGTTVGEFVAHRMRRGGTLRWRDRELVLRPASMWRERYAVVDNEQELVLLDGKGWGKRPVKVTMKDPGAVDPGLVLFAAFVVRGLAEDAGSTSAGAAAAGAAVMSG